MNKIKQLLTDVILLFYQPGGEEVRELSWWTIGGVLLFFVCLLAVLSMAGF